MTSPANVPAPRPVREGLLRLDPPALLGSRCVHCGTVVFPARDFCPACLADGPHDELPLSTCGRVFSYTVVHQAPGGRPTPYVLAFVDLPEQVRVLAQLDVAPQDVSLGMPVHLALRTVAQDAAGSVMGYAFAAAEAAQEVLR